MAEIMGSAPQLADRLNPNPHLLEAVLAPDFFDPIPPAEALEAELQVALSDAQALQDVLEQTRRWANDRSRQVAVHILRPTSDLDASGRAPSDIAALAPRGPYGTRDADLPTATGHLSRRALAVAAPGHTGRP